MWGMLLPLVSLAQAPPDAQQSMADHTGDGVSDTLTTWADIGSGWRQFGRCLRDGVSDHEVCRIVMTTSYHVFSGEWVSLAPAANNRAWEALPGPACAAPNPDDPTQAAMWQLASANPLEGSVTPPLRWHAGPPQPQAAVCMSPERAAHLQGAFSWDPSGSKMALHESGWHIVYTPPKLPAGRLRVVLQAEAWVIYQQDHALAVYEPAKDRHAWFLNLSDGSGEGFKSDRWQRIDGVSEAGPRAVSVSVRRQGQEDAAVRVILAE